jgi:hypothetical protein
MKRGLRRCSITSTDVTKVKALILEGEGLSIEVALEDCQALFPSLRERALVDVNAVDLLGSDGFCDLGRDVAVPASEVQVLWTSGQQLLDVVYNGPRNPRAQ